MWRGPRTSPSSVSEPPSDNDDKLLCLRNRIRITHHKMRIIAVALAVLVITVNLADYADAQKGNAPDPGIIRVIAIEGFG